MITPAVLFDLDGTLVDTAPDLIRALNAVLAHHGRAPIPVARGRSMVGHGGRVLLKHGFAGAGPGVDDALLEASFSMFLNCYENGIANESTVYPGLVAQLTRLADAGVGLGVATNKPERLARLLLTAVGIGHYFPVIIGGDTLARQKPHPAPLLAALKQLGVSPTRCVMVGDSQIDRDSAQAAAIAFIGVSFGYGSTPMVALGPDGLIDHYHELPGALHRLRPLDFPPP